MRVLVIVTTAVLVVAVGVARVGAAYCAPSNATCWPTDAEFTEFSATLSEGSRQLRWNGAPQPRPCAVPFDSPGEQPLYGLGWNGLPKASATSKSVLANSSELCYASPVEGGCIGAVRNNPLYGWKPGFVVWPLVAADVQRAVAFAVKHNLCLSVAGTGHDFLNRHSCAYGVLIRTTLMKEKTFNANSTAAGADGTFRFGPGITFSEAHDAAAAQGRYVASGWASTVGIVGWSLGGGHGPFAPSSGLGVDNIVEVEIATSPTGYGGGEILTVNATQHADLFWALRGGGGSTWGVVTAITVRAHRIPDGGFTVANAAFVGGFCPGFRTNGVYGDDALMALIHHVSSWMLQLDTNYGGLVWMWGSKDARPEMCGANWTVFVKYVYQGPENADLVATMTNLTAGSDGSPIAALQPTYQTFPNWYAYVEADLEPIYPWPWLPSVDGRVGGLPSIVASRDNFTRQEGNATTWSAWALHRLVKLCAAPGGACHRQELYQDITGNIGSQQVQDVSVNPGMRTGLLHWILGSNITADHIGLAYGISAYSYFGESALDFGLGPDNGPSWPLRLWGASTYARLLAVKQRWDPNGTFWCRHCVGDDHY